MSITSCSEVITSAVIVTVPSDFSLVIMVFLIFLMLGKKIKISTGLGKEIFSD